MFRFIKNIIFIIILAGLVAFFLPEIKSSFSQIQKQYFPCKTTLEYSLGSFDERFDLTKEEFLGVIKEAETLWEEPTGKDLFVYKENGKLKINLVYDSRQNATKALSDIGKVLNKNQNSYDGLKKEYEELKRDFDNKNLALGQRIKNFEVARDEYEKEVAMWNKQGGASEEAHFRLTNEKKALDKDLTEINRLQYDLNLISQKINILVPKMNELAKSLNLDVANYNNIAGMNGEEFDGGIYHIGPDGEYIDIYQFENKEKLLRVLAHEMGHALGILEHSEDVEAIMYRLNSGKEVKLSQGDLDLLDKICASSTKDKVFNFKERAMELMDKVFSWFQ